MPEFSAGPDQEIGIRDPRRREVRPDQLIRHILLGRAVPLATSRAMRLIACVRSHRPL